MADTQTETPKMDVPAYIQQANEAEAAQRAGKPLPEVEKAKEVVPAPVVAKVEESDTEKDKRISRSDRRKLKFVEDAAYWRGKAEALEARLGGKPEEKPAEVAPSKPQRKDFATDADYSEALATHAAENTTQKALAAEKQRAALDDMIAAASGKFNEDIKNFADWDEVKALGETRAKEAAENDEKLPEILPNTTLWWMVATSKQQAALAYHWVKNPDAFEEIVEMKDQNEQITAFRQLEGEVKVLYSSKQTKQSEAAQAVEETPKDRRHPAEAQAGRNSASELDAGKPRPSTEVAARGGSAAPAEPRIGSAAWMDQQNRLERERQRG